jgi:hypothetical protein
MSLPRTLTDREQDKFEEGPLGETRVKVTSIGTVTGEFTTSGLKIAGKISVVTINDATWTPLPAVALTNRNAILIQNQTNVQCKINYNQSEPGYVGIWVNGNGELYRDIKDTISIFARSSSGNIDLIIEELS